MTGFVNLAPDVRTYVASMKVNPNFESAYAAPGGDDRKMLAASAMQSAEADLGASLAPKLDALQAQGLVSNYEFVPLTGSVIINVPESNSAAAWDAIRGVDELGRIFRNREVSINPVFTEPKPPAPKPPVQPEYNVDKVRADDLWKQGIDGTGVTVGLVDTGAEATHPALKDHYRGTKTDGTFDHSYNFFDGIGGKAEAYDDNGHGTHTAGTAVGGTTGHIIGMAPGAKFIAAKAFTASGSGSTAAILKSLSWMLAPTDSAGQNPDPRKAPDIISNSWGNSNGRSLAYDDVFKAIHAAGIIPIASAGNSGRSGRDMSVGAPGSYPQVIAVAATDKDDQRASFSSIGPSPIKDKDGKNIPKPDIAAPGVAVVSAFPGGGYRALSGTSMSAPGAAGVAALLLQKYPNATPEQIRTVLQSSSVDLGEKGPDKHFGAGRIDAVEALKAADALMGNKKPPAGKKPVDPPKAEPKA